jgi:ubiquitin-protein ligase
MATYKRLINEYKKINEINEIEEIDNLSYKLLTIDSGNIMFRIDINFFYKKSEHQIKIYYNRLYPFQPPIKIEINNINIFILYKKIMKENGKLFNNCLCCNSLLCINNWNVSKSIIDILEEIKKVICYNELYIKIKLLNKITQKYTNQYLDYLEQYLV